MFKKFLSFFLIFSFMILNLSLNSLVNVDAKTIQEYQNQVNALQKEEEKLKKQVNDIKQQIANQNALIANLEKQVVAIDGNISALQTEINNMTKEIELLDKQIKDRLTLFKNRLKAMYMADKGSILDALFKNTSFSQFSLYKDSMERISKKDNELVNELTEKKKLLNEKKSQIEKDKIDLDKKRQDLHTKKQDIIKIEKELEQQRDKTQDEIKELVNEMQKANNAIFDLIQQSGSLGEFVGGRYAFPVPGYTRVSSHFGWRDIQGIKDLHTGTDFPAPMGTPVVAANAGKVIAVRTSSGGYKGGYGMHIIIDHGGGQHTLYAHMSAFNVSVGQFVQRGDRIGSVGSTGWSTGPHLHLEIRRNGVAVDPMPYLLS